MTHREPKKSCVIKDFCKPFKLSNESLCGVMKRLQKAIQDGLGKATHDSATVKCFPTYVQYVPSGKESGKFLAVDIGGALFRICLIILEPDKKAKMEVRTYAIPPEKIIGTSDELFDYIAESVEVFKSSLELGSEEYWLCFCFAFPHELNSINSGILVQWSKQFNVKGVVGKDVVVLLQQALDKRNLNIKVKAIVNDTVGCLISCGLDYQNCRIAVIAGTGTNACYMEKVENIEMIEDKSKPYMAINTEWANFGADGVLNDILTDVDREMDKNTLRPGNHIFEKMVSALYLCELIRVSLISCAEKRYLFQGEVPDKMKIKGAITPDHIFMIEKDHGEMLKTSQVLEEIGVSTPSIVDCVNVRYIVRTICKRSADLLSVAIATLINRVSLTPQTVGMDGGLIKHHPTYKMMLTDKVRCMVNPKIQFELVMSEDGSSRGAAAVVASIKAQGD